VEEALQGLCYVPNLELAWQLTDARTGTVTTHTAKRVVNYRGSFSDWQFAPRYAKDFAKIEMTFRVNSTAGALLAHTGPMGSVPWKWYVTRPAAEEEMVYSVPPLLAAQFTPEPAHVPPPGADPPEPDDTEYPTDPMFPEGRAHEAAPGPSAPGDGRSVTIPLAITAKAEKVAAILHDAGQSSQWISQLLLGLERQYETGGPWTERDREGRMRGAWDEVEQMEPLDVLRAIPNGARANAALLMSQLFRAAAPVAHSLTASRGWIAESIRMGNRARALQVCSALTKVELEDWTTKSRVKASGAGISDSNLAQGLAAGVPADALVLVPPIKGKGKLVPDEEAWSVLKTGAQQVEESTTNEFEALLKMAYTSGEADGSSVIDMLGYTPPWLTPKALGHDTNPADVTGPVPPDPALAPVVAATEADSHVEMDGRLIADVKAEYGVGALEGEDFGATSLTTTMLQPMPPSTTATALPPVEQLVAGEHGSPVLAAQTLDVPAAQRLGFQE